MVSVSTKEFLCFRKQIRQKTAGKIIKIIAINSSLTVKVNILIKQKTEGFWWYVALWTKKFLIACFWWTTHRFQENK